MKPTNPMNEAHWAYFQSIAEPALAVAPRDYLVKIRANLTRDGIPITVRRRDTAALFDHLVDVAQFQGISDRAAAAFTAKNGLVGWDDIAAALGSSPTCPRLVSYWNFDACGYRKTAGTCAESSHFTQCPLPGHPTRKGSLIQAAYSLFLFIRDVCGGDLIGWMDVRLAEADRGLRDPDRAIIMGAALLQPLNSIFGLSSKVWSMALASLLLAGDPRRERWVTTGAGMIVVDTLLHNFLHRTGVLRRFGADHLYGAGCYAPGGCSDLFRGLAARVDARQYGFSFPCFPRFVQFAIWRLASQSEENICNGNQINDTNRCQNDRCPSFKTCDRVPLYGSAA